MTTITHNNASTANKLIIARQIIFGPLAAQTLAGTVSGRMRGSESAGGVDGVHAIGIRTIASDGSTVRGTNKAVGNGGIEYATGTLTNRALASAAALNSVDIQAGDYLVIEIGLSQPPASSANTSSISVGDDSATDLPVDNTETNPYNPWVEFSQDIVLQTPATKGTIIQEPSSSVVNDVAFPVQPTVQLQDASNANVALAGVVVTASVATGAGILGGTLTATTDVNGLATFTNLKFTGLVGNRTITFTPTGLTPDTSGTVTVTAGAAYQISIVTEPDGAQDGEELTVQPEVAILDISGNATAVTSPSITVSISSGSGVLSGDVDIAPVAGTTLFTDLLVTGGATELHTLLFEGTGLVPATSVPFEVTAADDEPAGALPNLLLNILGTLTKAYHLSLLGDDYEPAPEPPPVLTSVTLTPSALAFDNLTPVTLVPVALDEDDNVMVEVVTFSFLSSDTNVATVHASTGVVTPVADGTCLITATVNQSGYPPVSGNATCVVVTPQPSLHHINMSLSSLSAIEGGSAVSITADPEDINNLNLPGLTLVWESDDELIATVAITSGYTAAVTPIAEGSCNIRAVNGAIASAWIPVTVGASSSSTVYLNAPGNHAGLFTGGVFLNPLSVTPTTVLDAYGCSVQSGATRLEAADYNDAGEFPLQVALPNPGTGRTKVLKGTVPYLHNGGTAPYGFMRSFSEKDELFIGTKFMVDPSFHLGGATGSKFAFLCQATYGGIAYNHYLNLFGAPNGTNGFRIATQFNGASSNNASWGSGYTWTQARRGKFPKVEILLVMNTPGSANGIFRTWVDDVVIANVTNAVFRLAGHTTAGWNRFYWNPTYGGGSTYNHPARPGTGANGSWTRTATTGANPSGGGSMVDSPMIAGHEVGRLWRFQDDAGNIILDAEILSNTTSVVTFSGDATGATRGGPKDGLLTAMAELYLSGV
jgi:hypothetical protein